MWERSEARGWICLTHPLIPIVPMPRIMSCHWKVTEWMNEWMMNVCTWIFFFFFLGLHLQHVEVPRLGVKLELQLQAYPTATATPDPSHICDLHYSLWQCQILNPLSEVRDPTWSSQTLCQVPNLPSHNGNSWIFILVSWMLHFPMSMSWSAFVLYHYPQIKHSS